VRRPAPPLPPERAGLGVPQVAAGAGRWSGVSAEWAGDGGARRRCRAHGIELACHFALPGGEEGTAEAVGEARRIEALAEPADAVRGRWSGGGLGLVHGAVLGDGSELRVRQGRDGDHLIEYGPHPFHLDAGLATLHCSPPQPPDPAWENALLGWVAYYAAVLTGTECLHASAVRFGPGVVAVAAPSGAGKTTLAAELIARGGRFVCDDVLALDPRPGSVWALPGAPFAHLDAGRAELAASLGTTSAQHGDELLVAVTRRSPAPAPIVAVVLLERSEEGPAPPRFEAAGLLGLRALAIGLPHLGGRERHRFAVLATLAEQASLLRLRASAALAPADLAAALERRLAAEGVL
jgi:hypothetical protein